MDAAARAAGIAEVNDPTADPSKEIPRDTEQGPYLSRKSENNSRVSLPVSHRSFSISSKYQRSFTNVNPPARQSGFDVSNKGGDGEQNEEGGHMAWDSSHPCWPHLNVHQPLDSPLYNSTRLIRIKRDWAIAGDLAPTFSSIYPEIFEPFMSEQQFRELIAHINEELVRIFDPYSFRAWLDAGIGLATGWLWEDLGLTGVKRELAKLDRWIEKWNNANGAEFAIIPLRRTAYLSLDVQIPDPQIGPDADQADADVNSNTAFARRALSVRLPNGINGSAAKSQDVSASNSISRPTDDGAYGAYPVVPPIPGKYLEEAQDNVSRQGSPRTAGQMSSGNAVAAA
ncbi:MAG: hypothetical protein Q9162_002378 [Coniocarpon cinnabarinum]